ncbi:hypothetical protein Fmac_003280 [Flemingia macrophylla]|uniref:Homeobox-leucine zipper protein n=1 Tax=Flemingia macrophylla TaxID=520843 RepID=A0ABD1NQA7_9FABA
MSFSSGIEHGEANAEEDLSDDGSQAGEKKRRLNMEQVKTLEKSFELGNKLEPERKCSLQELLACSQDKLLYGSRTEGLDGRQSSWRKTMISLKGSMKLSSQIMMHSNLRTKNFKLRFIMALKSREPTESINLNKETEGSCSNRSENSSDIKLDISRTPAIDSPLSTHQPSRPLFPSSARPAGVAQLFQTSSRPDIQCQKIDQMVKEESLSNMFCGMDDQSGFWPWLEQQHFN